MRQTLPQRTIIMLVNCWHTCGSSEGNGNAPIRLDPMRRSKHIPSHIERHGMSKRVETCRSVSTHAEPYQRVSKHVKACRTNFCKMAVCFENTDSGRIVDMGHCIELLVEPESMLQLVGQTPRVAGSTLTAKGQGSARGAL